MSANQFSRMVFIVALCVCQPHFARPTFVLHHRLTIAIFDFQSYRTIQLFRQNNVRHSCHHISFQFVQHSFIIIKSIKYSTSFIAKHTPKIHINELTHQPTPDNIFEPNKPKRICVCNSRTAQINVCVYVCTEWRKGNRCSSRMLLDCQCPPSRVCSFFSMNQRVELSSRR